MRVKLIIFVCLCAPIVCAQTGPAGVGNSTSNSLWLKADAGTSTTTNGAAISSWNDMSGNANHVSQTTAVQRPLYSTGIMNGFPAILFDNNNTAGQNDYLTGNDASSLDNTSGFTIFTVTRMTNLGDARSIIAKRTNVGVNQAYMFFYYTSNYINVDIESNDDRWTTTPTAFATGTNYILDFFYDGTLANPRSRVYSAQTLVKSGNESATSLIDYASPLIIGSTHVGDNRPFGGYIAEIIFYREALNDARRIIVDNYLSSKYNIALAANDKYAGDTPGNGNFDYEVAGIGQESVTAMHTQFSPSASAGIGITYKSGFDNGDYVMVGHNLLTNNNINTDISVVAGGPVDRRWERTWYIDVTNTSTTIVADIIFDLSDGGFPTLNAGLASNYKLLYRSANAGNWTIVSTAGTVSGDQITFSDFNFSGNAQDGFYTIATLNNTISPLPVELLSFNAIFNAGKTELSWQTASEINNDFFTIERSKNGIDFETVRIVDGAGTSNQMLEYFDTDQSPLSGISYYRLKQTDFDGAFTYSNIIPVNNYGAGKEIGIYPNPSDGASFNMEFTGFGDEEVLVMVRDIQGKEFYSKVYVTEDHNKLIAIDLESRLSPGTYLVIASSRNELFSKKLIVR